LTHGFTAQNVLLSHEDPAVFEQLRQDVMKSLNPQDVLEFQLADRAASLLWRLRRVPLFELALFELGAERGDPLDNLIDVFDEADESEMGKLGQVVKALLNTDLISKLGRYEISLHKQLYQTLERIISLKKAGPSSGPASGKRVLG
jgi:hypothetical protein